MPRMLGGLGIRDIRIANQSLMMKWMWQWHDRDNNWWKQATVMNDPSGKPWNDPNGSQFWKSINPIEAAFNCSTVYHIGNGESVQFWHANWHGTPLKLLFPSLYQVTTTKQHSIAQCKTPNGWSFQFTTLSPTAHEESNSFNLHLQQLNTVLSQTQDQIEWIRKPGKFLVGSAYEFLSHTPSPKSNLHNIWKIKAPLRVQIFAWLLHTNRLTTVDNLVRRGWNLPNICVMCNADAESIPHLFQNCTAAATIRAYIRDTFQLQYQIPAKFTAHNSMEMLTDPMECTKAKQWEITTSYVIWRERCRRIFSDRLQTYISLVREIKLEFSNWFADYGPATAPTL